MSDFRVFAPAPAQDTISLPPAESHHLVTVNRARTGDTIIAFDGRGTEWTCELTDARKSGATLRVTATHTRAPLPCAITLAQALPKGGVMDDIIRHATELGTARIVPLSTERTQVHLDGDRSDKKIEKWRTTALEAAKQCGNPFLPEITGVQSLNDFLAGDSVRGAELRLVASLHDGAKSLKRVLVDFRDAHEGRSPANVIWLVGPEGDFSPAEMAAITAASVVPVTLGPLVLRCDTAATAALSVLIHETTA
ncbi:RsmE family RNA methyltransferase [Rariglobus hedericola]|uniref:Ribosomal RNA small subunit methyltransferase E n=1 Tax=Rariglobus hedericola TaxID=2597822 RepID=A0A556QRB5_9BACT|nr:RsmE family RNA methyltransferase [Rariglobus hedericola]TSJ79185.1 16S rRNA (uracil(1498)-N(3))-methyltransferase [Rariglobus hedericola]